MFTNISELLSSVSRLWYPPLLLISGLAFHFSVPSRFYTMVLGFGHSTFISAEDTIPLNLKSKENGSTSPAPRKQISLLQFCKDIVPPLRLNPLLFNGHLQTIWSARPGEDIPIHYKRRIFQSNSVPFPGQFAVDFVVPPPAVPRDRDRNLPPRTHYFSDDEFDHLEESDDRSPLLVVLHGISGGSHEDYIRHVLRPLTSEEGGWSALVVIARGCAWSKITTGRVYNARATWDVRQVVDWAREKWPKRRLFGIGFSLGANILTNYIAEEGDACPFEASVMVSNPWNLDVANTHLKSTFMGREVYSKTMGLGLRKLFQRHQEQMMQNSNIDLEKVLKSKHLYEWDRYVQCPIWGYPTESAYYRDASCSDAILNVRVPMLALHAVDDPVVSDQCVPYEEMKLTPYIVLCATSIGGHLAWFEFSGGRWFSNAASAFLLKYAKDTDGPAPWKQENSKLKSAAIDANKPIFDPLRRRLYIKE